MIMASLLIYRRVGNRMTRVGKVEGSVPKSGSEFVFDGKSYVVQDVEIDVRMGRPPTIKVFLHENLGY